MVALTARGIAVETDGGHLLVCGATRAAVSEIASEHGARLLELTEATTSLEDSLLDLTVAQGGKACRTRSGALDLIGHTEWSTNW